MDWTQTQGIRIGYANPPDMIVYLQHNISKMRNRRGRNRLLSIQFRGAEELFSKAAWTLESGLMIANR